MLNQKKTVKSPAPVKNKLPFKTLKPKENIVSPEPKYKKNKCSSCVRLLSFGLSTRNCQLCVNKTSRVDVLAR